MKYIHANHWSDIQPEDWPAKNFTPKEVADRSTGEVMVCVAFLVFIDQLRDRVGESLSVSSWYRTPEHNNEVSSTGLDGPHTTGKAVDIKCHGSLAHRVLVEALEMGAPRIGVSQKGDFDARFIHIDFSNKGPTPWVWSY